ncbi:AfsR/SARP family transcriptional regulator [Micromonospora sp. CPCC 206061]|uniref:AfsR/SARP family transcriptional regulator n=1 Tax=Micromonospora sp. CPCC 206061 TaxID=3122410 RepID=UPI002FEF4A68
MRIQVLGPVRAWRGDDELELELGPAAQRAVLGLLALACGQPLTRAQLVSGVWYDREPPSTAANVIQTHVKHLRRLLEPGRRPHAPSALLRQVGDGYALQVPAAAVDVSRFRALTASAAVAQREGQLDRAAELLDEALGLWQGPPFADVPALASHPKVVALAGERQAALDRYGEVKIAAGRAAEVLPALEEAAAEQPLDEAGQARLIRAYHAAGRRGQAFTAYHEARRRLADELGVAPGAELSAAHTLLLRDDAPVAASAGPARRAAARPLRPVPAQLPTDVPGFVGRAAELAQLGELLEASAVRICVVSGTAGVGKTALAVRWAHDVAHRFPDGQLYVNLRGFDPGGVAMDPSEAVRRLLDALDVPPERIPSDLDSRSALYRSQLAGRRLLVVLDNARDPAQVRPLLPGAPGCAVVVTSRHQLSSLVAAEGAQHLPLDLLTASEAHDLLARRVGARRVAGEPSAVAEILARCSGLPLAVAVVAARAAVSRHLPFAALAEQFRGDGDCLDALTTGDPSTDLRAVLSWSYRALVPEAARLFRLLGLHPGPDVSVPAAASLAARPAPQVRQLIAELVGANLLTEHTPGRYTSHDLLRAYASDLAERLDKERPRRAAIRRMVEHYLHSAYAADQQLDHGRARTILRAPTSGVVPEHPADLAEARAWFSAERAVLLGALERASTVSSTHEWQLASTLYTFMDRDGHWDDLAATQRAGVAAARRDGEVAAEAAARRFLARAHTRRRRFEDAHAELRRALDLYGQAGDRIGQGHTHLNLALLWDRLQRRHDALHHAQKALAVFEAAGDKHGRARALNATGWYHELLGDHRQALTYCRQALTQLQALDDVNGQAGTWDSLAHAHHGLGEHARAVTCYEHAIALYRRIGDQHLVAIVQSSLGETHEALGAHDKAREVWREALAILADVDHQEAETVRAKLAALAGARHRHLRRVAV